MGQSVSLAPVFPGTDGAQKVRIGFRGKGRSGGLRVIFYFDANADVIHLLSVFSKSRKADLTAAERNAIKDLIKTL